MANLNETITNGVVGLLMALCGTYLIAIRKGAESLDTGLRNELAARDLNIQQKSDTIQQLTQHPKRTPSEEHAYTIAEAALQKLGPDCRDVLRLLKLRGSLSFGRLNPVLPDGMNAESTREVLNRCEAEHLVSKESIQHATSWEYKFTVAPGMIPALDKLLY
ncbi:MAG: hypothetical protein ABJF23_03225 [Bryobacteraceae bacterium]